MKKLSQSYLPMICIFLLQNVLTYRAIASESIYLRQLITPFSFMVAVLIFFTGVLPALIHPQESHTIVACFAISFAFFILIPFELKDLPIVQPGVPLYQLIPPHLSLRLIQGGILLPMAIHVSSWFPHRNHTSLRLILSAYILSLFLVTTFLLSTFAWQRITTLLFLLIWFTVVIILFFKNLLHVTQDATPENIKDAQRARIVLFSIALAEIPLWFRPFTLTLGLDIFPYNLLLLFQLFIPIGISYAVFRHDLFGIDRVVRRTLIYGTISLLLLTLYLTLTTSITFLFADVLASRPLTPIISLFVAAILFDPTRKFVQTWLDKLLYPDRLKFQAAIQHTQNLLARANRRDEIIHLLSNEFPTQIGSEWGALTLFPEPDVPPAQLTPAWNARLVAGNVSFGGYWLGARKAGPVFDTEETLRLNALAQQAAFALAYANAYETLYQLNQTLEERVNEQTQQALADQKSIAAYEERQKIARDLHDSVTQSLFGIHLIARGLAAKSAPETKDDLQALELQARETLKEMRLLLNQLRNVSVEENVNLTEAIQNMCEAFAQRSGPEGGLLLSITLNLPERVILPKNIVEEVLWVIRECLQNIIKHSESRTAQIAVHCTDKLLVTIEDNGVGFNPDVLPTGHYGLRGIRERIFALGGDFNMDAELGKGTKISFVLSFPK